MMIVAGHYTLFVKSTKFLQISFLQVSIFCGFTLIFLAYLTATLRALLCGANLGNCHDDLSLPHGVAAHPAHVFDDVLAWAVGWNWLPPVGFASTMVTPGLQWHRLDFGECRFVPCQCGIWGFCPQNSPQTTTSYQCAIFYHIQSLTVIFVCGVSIFAKLIKGAGRNVERPIPWKSKSSTIPPPLPPHSIVVSGSYSPFRRK